MGTFAGGFYWSLTASIATVLGILVLLAALVLFWRYGRQPASPAANKQPPLEYPERFDLAVVGAIARGNKPVGASEFIATCMSLVRRGILPAIMGSDSTPIGIMTGASTANLPLSEIDTQTLKLLSFFTEKDGGVYLRSAKGIAERKKSSVESAYQSWKLLVSRQAVANMAASATARKAQRAILYGGYALILLAGLASYLVSLMTSLPLLIAGGLLIALCLLMQRNLSGERQKIRELIRWLDSLETHPEDIPTNAAPIQRLLEYAVLFGLGDKTAATLAETQNTPAIDAAVANLGFWKSLKQELYTTPD